LVLTNEKDSVFKPNLCVSFLAAVPGSRLLKEAFNQYLQLMLTQKWDYPKYIKIFEWNDDTGVNALPNGLSDILNSIVEDRREKRLAFFPRREEDSLCNQLFIQMQMGSPTVIDAEMISSV
jgi:hypothetical protein